METFLVYFLSRSCSLPPSTLHPNDRSLDHPTPLYHLLHSSTLSQATPPRRCPSCSRCWWAGAPIQRTPRVSARSSITLSLPSLTSNPSAIRTLSHQPSDPTLTAQLYVCALSADETPPECNLSPKTKEEREREREREREKEREENRERKSL